MLTGLALPDRLADPASTAQRTPHRLCDCAIAGLEANDIRPGRCRLAAAAPHIHVVRDGEAGPRGPASRIRLASSLQEGDVYLAMITFLVKTRPAAWYRTK